MDNRFSLLALDDDNGIIPIKAQKAPKNKKKVRFTDHVEQNIVPSKYTVGKGNGNVYNTHTLYCLTGSAHTHQLIEIFTDVVDRAKNMPEIFGDNFQCTVRYNHICRSNGQYIHALIDISNPKLYYALLGMNVDGSPNVEVIQPEVKETSIDEETFWDNTKPNNWAEYETPDEPTIIELPPLISLNDYEYDADQKSFSISNGGDPNQNYGHISISPAFITPGVQEGHNPLSLFVSNCPNDLEFLQQIFARYARYPNSHKHNYPKINIKQSKQQDSYFAIVSYSHQYDAAFALVMTRKMVLLYCGKEILINVRYAMYQHNRQKTRN